MSSSRTAPLSVGAEERRDALERSPSPGAKDGG
jgi:hypothetical protein